MKYINVEEFDINSPEKAPLKDFIILLGGILGVLYIIFLISGFFIDRIIYAMPSGLSAKIESKMAETLSFQKINTKNHSLEEEKLQQTIDLLSSNEKKLGKRKFKVFILHNQEVNAFAFPGGKIYITESLLKEVNSEKEINFVLAHELGHFANKDHLRLLGRKFMLIGLSVAFLGENNSITNFLVNSVEKMELKYSQEQELNADLFAANLLYEKYKDTTSGLNFMRKISRKNKLNKFVYFFATHPHPEDRIRSLENNIGNLKKYS